MAKKLEDYGVSEDAFDLQRAAERILSIIEGIYQANNMPLPAKRYWGIGRAAEDCEQLVVSFMRMYLGAPGLESNAPQHCNQPRTAVFNISVTRNIPSGVKGNPAPTELAMQASAFTAADVTLLMSAVNQFDRWDDFGPGVGVIATVAAPDASGLLQTVNMTLTLAIG